MMPLATGARVWIAASHTDMRRGMQSLALQVQEALKRDPHAGDLYVFRGRSGSLVKILWHDGIGTSLYAKRLDAGFNKLYEPDRKPGPITQAGCWAHARRKLFELADIASKARNQKPTTISPIAFEAVRKLDAIFALERSINGSPAKARVAARRKDVAPLVNDLIAWMKQERCKLSRHNEVAKAMDYMLKRIDVFTRFLDDGRICLSNNAAERELRGIALGRKSWLFAGSDRGGERAAVMLTLMQTCKLNNVDPQAWLADVLARIADHKITNLAALLPWNWCHAAIPVERAA